MWHEHSKVVTVESHTACRGELEEGKPNLSWGTREGFTKDLQTSPWADFQRKSRGLDGRFEDYSRQRGQQRQRNEYLTAHETGERLVHAPCLLVSNWEGWLAGRDGITITPPISLWDVQNALLPLPSSSCILVLFMGQFRCFLGNCSFFMIFVSLHEIYIMHSLWCTVTLFC